MDEKELEAALESILFVSGEPISITRLSQGLGVKPSVLIEIAQRLMDMYRYERRGIRLIRLEESYQLCCAPEYAPFVRQTLESRKPPRLSKPALEVLAIVAYYQPVTRAYIDQVRGVDSANTVALLLERELIEEAGRLPVPGRPVQFRTTATFLRTFHLNSLEELPQLPSSSVEGQQLRMDLESALGTLRQSEGE